MECLLSASAEMSKHLQAKYVKAFRKRKRAVEESGAEEESSRPAAMTNAEKMRHYRLRKRIALGAESRDAIEEPMLGRAKTNTQLLQGE